ncbi:hypothetical protein [Vibrio salinus]|uniref:hypothetical protein n=1 Tax=Vibrio salinus TaxID=2899784 RepID=UPI001E59AB74|nr:hypothetical protein [Vibrio salinus]MCE0495085.1 hypothetical protein [Vibrio salinus]
MIRKAVRAGGFEAAGFNAGLPLELSDKVELLKLASSDGYAPANVYLYDIMKGHPEFDTGNSIKLLKDALLRGCGSEDLVSYYESKLPKINTIDDIRTLSDEDHNNLYYAYYSLIMNGLGSPFKFKTYRWVMDKKNKVQIELFSQKDKKEIEEKAKKFLDKVKPNMFFDESTSVHGLLGAG